MAVSDSTILSTAYIQSFDASVFPRFPIQEYGMNYESQPLQKHEVESMKVDPLVIERIVASYRLMLDFYGMKLVSVETGLLARADPPRDFTARYKNLVRELYQGSSDTGIWIC